MTIETKDNKRAHMASLKELFSNGLVVLPPLVPDCVSEYLSERATVLDDQMAAMALAVRCVQRKGGMP